MRVLKYLPLVVLGFLTACGGTANPTGSPTSHASSTASATPSASATPVAWTACTVVSNPTPGEPAPSSDGIAGSCQVAQILYPPSGMECGPGANQTYEQSGCPMTPSLAQALDKNPTSGPGGGAAPLCRCQNTWQSATFRAEPEAGGQGVTYDVQVVLDFGGDSEKFTVVVFGVESGFLADDIYCTNGGPSTSIKGASPGPCA